MSAGGRVQAVHQVAAGMAPRDAISQHVLEARRLLREWGFASEIYSDNIHPALAGDVHSAKVFPQSLDRDSLIIVHYSIDSPIFAEAARSGAQLAMHYHNITPAELLRRFAPEVAEQCAIGRERLPSLAPRVEASWADSAFNAEELRQAGYRNPESIGILRAALPPAHERDRSGHDGPIRLLFVGRGIPNKAQHDLVLTLGALAEVGRPAELTLIGDWGSAPRYRKYCEELATRLGVTNRLRILGSVDDDDLAAAYRDNDVFLCLSDHEGFCVPLLEAMNSGLPIVAYAAGAVPETVGDAGLLLPEKSPSLVAEAVMAVHDMPELSARMADARVSRLHELGPETVVPRLRAAVTSLVGAA